ncbi:hypothetical protein TGMAS_286928, partial [Toxoplasma gondii MAS]
RRHSKPHRTESGEVQVASSVSKGRKSRSRKRKALSGVSVYCALSHWGRTNDAREKVGGLHPSRRQARVDGKPRQRHKEPPQRRQNGSQTRSRRRPSLVRDGKSDRQRKGTEIREKRRRQEEQKKRERERNEKAFSGRETKRERKRRKTGKKERRKRKERTERRKRRADRKQKRKREKFWRARKRENQRGENEGREETEEKKTEEAQREESRGRRNREELNREEISTSERRRQLHTHSRDSRRRRKERAEKQSPSGKCEKEELRTHTGEEKRRPPSVWGRQRTRPRERGKRRLEISKDETREKEAVKKQLRPVPR